MGWKCLLGHKGEWYYVSDNTCQQERICERSECRKHQTRIKHPSWSEWEYKSSNNCEQERFCERCNDTETRTIHSWSSWQYKHPQGDCTEVRLCQRCSEIESRLNLTSHQYDSQEYYIFPEQCYVMKICQRCNYQLPMMKKEHQWVDWFAHPQYANYLIRVCNRCNERETQSI